jgi:tetratricopeptide (TPR) repeat protein
VGEDRAFFELARAEYRLGTIDLNADKLDQAEEHYRQALEAANTWLRGSPKSPDAIHQVFAIRHSQIRARVWRDQGLAVSSDLIAFIGQVREAATAMPDDQDFSKMLGVCLFELGVLYNKDRSLDLAGKYYAEALVIAQKQLDTAPRANLAADLILGILNSQAVLAADWNDLMEVERLYKEVAKLADVQLKADADSITAQLHVADSLSRWRVSSANGIEPRNPSPWPSEPWS